MSITEPRPAANEGDENLAADVEKLVESLAAVKSGIAEVIYGQTEVVDEVLITLLAGGHALLIGVPGLAKTRLVETLGTVLGLAEKRVQFTPDLMPADIIGSEVLEEGEGGKRSFRFIQGPVFSQLLMGDEINRASPRTQSALLQAMQEKHVSVAGHRHILPKPFHVLATQNQLGGYGVKLNSSACEDIDSIEPLIRLTKINDYKRLIIKQSLHRALPWLLTNMNEDGGFVFRRNEAFVYGHEEMSSGVNESSMFATWFRTLCLAYLINYLNSKSVYQLNRVPGYEFN